MDAAMTVESPDQLYHFVKRAWAPETISTPFDPANPCLNQCAVTALAVQHLLGGDIIKTATKGGTHFYNLIDGRYWDLAADQFAEPIPYENRLTNADEAYDHATPAQVSALLANIQSLR